MGTTGGDREKLMADVAASGTYAVIAPNMGKQVQGAREREGEEGSVDGCFIQFRVAGQWKLLSGGCGAR